MLRHLRECVPHISFVQKSYYHYHYFVSVRLRVNWVRQALMVAVLSVTARCSPVVVTPQGGNKASREAAQIIKFISQKDSVVSNAVVHPLKQHVPQH